MTTRVEPGDEFRLLTDDGLELCRGIWRPPAVTIQFFGMSTWAYATKVEHVRSGEIIRLDQKHPVGKNDSISVHIFASKE